MIGVSIDVFVAEMNPGAPLSVEGLTQTDEQQQSDPKRQEVSRSHSLFLLPTELKTKDNVSRSITKLLCRFPGSIDFVRLLIQRTRTETYAIYTIVVTSFTGSVGLSFWTDNKAHLRDNNSVSGPESFRKVQKGSERLTSKRYLHIRLLQHQPRRFEV